MKRLITLFVFSFFLSTTQGCGTSIQPSSPDTSAPQVSAPTKKISTLQPTASISQPSATERVIAPATSTTDPSKVSLPDSSDVPPGDVIAQLAFTGRGAGTGAGECQKLCIDVDDHSISLSGYPPLQQLRILVYTSAYSNKISFSSTCSFNVAEYITEWYVTVDRNGHQDLSVSGASTNDKTFLVYDALTGELLAPHDIRSLPDGLMLSFEQAKNLCTNLNSPNSCPGAPPQTMIVGERGYVCTGIDNVKVRQSPSRSASEITRLAPGTNFDVQDGPSCSDNWSWWYIETDDGIEGWVSEGGDDIDPYFICPSP